MADYFAVLNRTLSGFSDPKPALRAKLYDRARDTIARQLEMRRPTMDDETIAAELAKLEDAITEIEGNYADSPPPPVVEQADTAPAVDDTPVASAPELKEEPVEDIPPAETGETEVVGTDEVEASEEIETDAGVEPDAAQSEPVFDRGDETSSLREILSSGSSGEGDAALDAMDETLQPLEERMFEPQEPVADGSVAPDGIDSDAGSLGDTIPELAADAVAAEASSDASLGSDARTDLAATSEADAVEAWADEFLAMQPSTSFSADIDTQADADANGDDTVQPTKEPVEEISKTVESFSASTSPVLPKVDALSTPTSPPSAPDVGPPSDPPPVKPEPLSPVSRDTPLTIPPAPAYADTRKSRVVKRRRSGAWTWLGLVGIALLALLAMVFLLPQAAPYRDGAIRMLGLQDSLGTYFENPAVRPTPVKTIPIVPPEEDAVVDDPPETVQPAVKREERLTEDGTETASEPTVNVPIIPDVAAPVVDEPVADAPVVDAPVVDAPETPLEAPAEAAGDDEAAPDATVPATPEPVAVPDAPAATPEGPSAILYEEGTTPGENSFDAGAVRWSLTQEDIGAGSAEPVITGRMDIPGRNMVLLLSVKRNVDAALPASHLIELIFAVPDEFSGGTIADINRFVMKESEQSRGENLVGVPAKLGDGLFLIALNNLDQARATNVNLLSTRGWIDIPLQYRTGRRALVTLEKGAEGTRVFSEAFDAWSRL